MPGVRESGLPQSPDGNYRTTRRPLPAMSLVSQRILLTKCIEFETIPILKPAIFHPAALQAIRQFPDDVKRAMGEAILKLQYGATLKMPLSRPMPSVAHGVAELRMKDRSGIYRTFYYTRNAQGIFILHAFVKKTQATLEHEIVLARRRLKELTHEAQ